MPAVEIRDCETGLVLGPFSWFQSRQLFLETHETLDLAHLINFLNNAKYLNQEEDFLKTKINKKSQFLSWQKIFALDYL